MRERVCDMIPILNINMFKDEKTEKRRKKLLANFWFKKVNNNKSYVPYINDIYVYLHMKFIQIVFTSFKHRLFSLSCFFSFFCVLMTAHNANFIFYFRYN